MFGFGVKTITVTELAKKLSGNAPVLLDVREPSEYEGGHVPGAVNVPLGTLANHLGEYEPASEIFTICQSGHRSATAAKIMKRAGFKNVASVKGGTLAWTGNLAK